MAESSASQTVTVINPEGLHARPAYMFVELATKFDAQIEVIKENERIDGKSILSILTLGAEQGTELSLLATGPDAEDAVNQLARLFADGFPGRENGKETDET